MKSQSYQFGSSINLESMPTIMVIPSGIGCSIGGFAGDAIPTARLLAAASGCLITHPNVLNGASCYWSDSRLNYVEGYALDQFTRGEIFLRPIRQQKIGLLLDAGLDPDLKSRHLQVADACRVSLGLNVGPVVITEVPLQVQLKNGLSGSSWGELKNPDQLLRAGDKLMNEGVTAIAIVTRFPDMDSDEQIISYRQGKGVDPLAGAEAIISHLLTRHLAIPCAHTPGLSELPLDAHLDPRVAGEELGHTFLPCVLVGLSRAPDIVPTLPENKEISRGHSSGLIHIDQLGAVIAPEGSLGGESVLACLERNIPLIVVRNDNLLNVHSENLFRDFYSREKNKKITVLKAANYLEAAAMIMLLREGISLESVERPISQIKQIEN